MDTNSTKTNVLTTTGNNQLPISVNVAKGLKNISADIEREQSRLEEYLDDINSKQTSINIKRTWVLGGVSKESVEAAIEKVFKETIYGNGTCVKAIQSTNKNMSYTLELIKLLALAEKDLYEHIDNQCLTSNEIKEFLVDWCKKQGVNENEIRELFECSFQRAYTLRDRINELRNALKEHIREISTRIESIESNYNSLIDNIENTFKSQTENLNNLYIEKTTQIAKLAENIKGDMSSTSETKKKLLNEEYEKFYKLETEATSELNGLITDAKNNIAAIKKMLDSFKTQCEESNRKILEQKVAELDAILNNDKGEINQLAEKIQKEISEISETKKELLNKEYEKFENLETTATSKLVGLMSDVDNKTENLKKMFDTFQIQWEDDYKKITALYHKKNIWTIVSSVCASGIISTLLFLLLR